MPTFHLNFTKFNTFSLQIFFCETFLVFYLKYCKIRSFWNFVLRQEKWNFVSLRLYLEICSISRHEWWQNKTCHKSLLQFDIIVLVFLLSILFCYRIHFLLIWRFDAWSIRFLEISSSKNESDKESCELNYLAYLYWKL